MKRKRKPSTGEISKYKARMNVDGSQKMIKDYIMKKLMHQLYNGQQSDSSFHWQYSAIGIPDSKIFSYHILKLILKESCT